MEAMSTLATQIFDEEDIAHVQRSIELRKQASRHWDELGAAFVEPLQAVADAMVAQDEQAYIQAVKALNEFAQEFAPIVEEHRYKDSLLQKIDAIARKVEDIHLENDKERDFLEILTNDVVLRSDNLRFEGDYVIEVEKKLVNSQNNVSIFREAERKFYYGGYLRDESDNRMIEIEFKMPIAQILDLAQSIQNEIGDRGWDSI